MHVLFLHEFHLKSLRVRRFVMHLDLREWVLPVSMPPKRYRSQKDDDASPPPPPPQMKPYERASVDMLAGITRMLERQSESSGKSHEEDVAERFRKKGPKEFAGTTGPLGAE
ncbi:hypothetical protein F511_16707 [Dorcoceras hygrometricum]|uniref:Uncharacterized protein n=1 Tax=Dorcoceras hygrometricum TaxID=472368 RepID=A0A2Z7DG55_9LAMI|nr:hypothetical protein F511_16707 [Dorcoceras hygrometricum]